MILYFFTKVFHLFIFYLFFVRFFSIYFFNLNSLINIMYYLPIWFFKRKSDLATLLKLSDDFHFTQENTEFLIAFCQVLSALDFHLALWPHLLPLSPLSLLSSYTASLRFLNWPFVLAIPSMCLSTEPHGCPPFPFSVCSHAVFFFFVFRFIYLFFWGGRAEGESFKQTPCWAQSLTWGSMPWPWDHDLSWNRVSSPTDWATQTPLFECNLEST